MFIHSSVEQVDDLWYASLAMARSPLSRTWLNLPFFAKLGVDRSRFRYRLHISCLLRHHRSAFANHFRYRRAESHYHNLCGVRQHFLLLTTDALLY